MGRIARFSSARATTLARVVTASSLTLVVLTGLAGPAAAAPPDKSAAHTEDSDTNDRGTPNNVVDHGDNAHPSGRDRSVEHGGSGNQGRATADPDDDGRGPDRSNGGVDQPNGRGGVDKADQDGNNGCGNDDDFEDDNEGRCGGAPKPQKPQKSQKSQKAEDPAPAAPKKAPAAAPGGSKHSCSTRPTGNGNGANGSGAYGSTCDGSPSQNGNGGGQAGGKPCAGCVGNADDKNPPGQRPNGSDRNAGYECDRNHGVGRGNPAHSGCATTASVPPPPKTPVPPTTVPPTKVPPTTDVPPTTPPPGPPATVPPTTVVTGPPRETPRTGQAAEVLGTDVTAATPEVVALGSAAATPADLRPSGVRGMLASTGLPVSAILGLAAAALGLGGAAVIARRRVTS